MTVRWDRSCRTRRAPMQCCRLARLDRLRALHRVGAGPLAPPGDAPPVAPLLGPPATAPLAGALPLDPPPAPPPPRLPPLFDVPPVAARFALRLRHQHRHFHQPRLIVRSRHFPGCHSRHCHLRSLHLLPQRHRQGRCRPRLAFVRLRYQSHSPNPSATCRLERRQRSRRCRRHQQLLQRYLNCRWEIRPRRHRDTGLRSLPPKGRTPVGTAAT